MEGEGRETNFFRRLRRGWEEHEAGMGLPGYNGGGAAESGAGARALQNLPAYRSRALNAKRRGVRNASSALAMKQAHSTHLKNFVPHPKRRALKEFSCAKGGSCGSILLLYDMEMRRERVIMYYSGPVQGIGFRYTVRRLVNGYEATGTVRNLDDGRVELVAEGVREELEALLEAVRQSDVGRFIRQEQMDWTEARNEFRGFEITH